jgi:hypothetical protein
MLAAAASPMKRFEPDGNHIGDRTVPPRHLAPEGEQA